MHCGADLDIRCESCCSKEAAIWGDRCHVIVQPSCIHRGELFASKAKEPHLILSGAGHQDARGLRSVG